MITRSLRRPHVCLRCQRSPAKRSIGSASQAAPQPTSASNNERFEHDRARYSNERSEDNGSIRDGLTNKSAAERLHGHRGVQQQESREFLGGNALGDPAQVIVLRDSNLTLYDHKTDRVRGEDARHIDILGQLAEERGLVGLAEVEENINALRPAIGQEPETWDGVNELVQQMQDSFTVAQLRRYLERFAVLEPEVSLHDKTTKDENFHILRVTPWLPGISQVEDNFNDDPMRGYVLDSHTIKQRVILRLLRQCWMVELPNVRNGIGQFEIKLRREDLELFLVGGFPILDRIQSSHLHQDDERLEAFRTRGVIRVTSPHSKKQLVVDAISDVLKRVRRKLMSFDYLAPPKMMKHDYARQVGRWADKHFDDGTLEALGRLTMTSIARQPRRTILISTIDKENAPVSGVDVARRLLLIAASSSDRVDHELAYLTSTPKKCSFVKQETVQTLPWRDRLRNWARWTAATTQESVKSAPKVDKQPTVSTLLASGSVEAAGKMKQKQTKPIEQAPEPEGSRLWSMRNFTERSALMGKVLHTLNTFPGSAAGALSLANPERISTFSSQVPSLSRVLSKAQVRNDGAKMDSLVLRFLPNPFPVALPQTEEEVGKSAATRERSFGAAALSAFPSIEMRFAIDPSTKETVLRDIQAVVHESKTDVMLPHINTDVRFQQRTTARLTNNSIKPIREFIANSDLTVDGPQLLHNPPSITLPISRHLCRSAEFNKLEKIMTESPSLKKEDARNVEYLFAGLELRSTLVFEYKDWRLLYTSIEAGKAGGRRAELKLRPIRSTGVSNEQSFVKMAYTLANDIGGQNDSNSIRNVMEGVRRVALSEEKNPLIQPALSSGLGREKFKNYVRRIDVSPQEEGDESRQFGYRLEPNQHEDLDEDMADDGQYRDDGLADDVASLLAESEQPGTSDEQST